MIFIVKVRLLSELVLLTMKIIVKASGPPQLIAFFICSACAR
ncbi:hypothetical protein [Paenibacillus eucommiae]|uniref:Uncharacterized protein n=1 Tax=Paenibacillus eucommiae TaxID=1355755 RepID=A0ABS4J0H5_9BACL|nr:hypothetical protein [Paenibacillus eucommiae]MBP1993320.1 hypothetical protein [Paenibacillus eucommiae]